MEKLKRLWARKVFRMFVWALLILLGLYLVLVAFRVVHFFNLDKTNAQIEKIHNTRLTLDDVMGTNLPPEPVDADETVAGVDANQNGIRDDVELAIFKEYPNSAKTRAVLLQYALVLQMQMTLPVVNKETVTATVEDNESRANVCMWSLSSRSNMEKFLADIDKYENFIKELQLNTEQRKGYLHDFFEGNLGSYTMSRESCDIDLSTLSN